MEKLNINTVEKPTLPVKFLQFGEGNFLRAFVDWMVQKANNSLQLNMGGVIVQPLEYGMVEKLKEQDCLYHVVLEGIKDGKPTREIQRVDCIMDAINPYTDYQKYKEYFLMPELELVLSNTTEAGIVKMDNEDIFAEPPASFPGKVTALLYERFKKYSGAADKGLTFICCELIENNATQLHSIVIDLAKENNLDEAFIAWVNSACSFCNSLVDRIVTGFPKGNIKEVQEELGFEDNMVVTAEYFHLWAIEGGEKEQEQFPLQKAGLNVLWMGNLKAFRDKKVRVLNGAHTALVPVGLLSGYKTVKEAFGNKDIEQYIRKLIAEEVLPSIEGEKEELEKFADEILERFLNPYIRHQLKDISLNSISKWVTRDYPSLTDYVHRTNALPKRLSFSLAALVHLYAGNHNIGFEANDTNQQLSWMQQTYRSDVSLLEKVTKILYNESLWGVNLTELDGLVEAVISQIESIRKNGIIEALKKLEVV